MLVVTSFSPRQHVGLGRRLTTVVTIAVVAMLITCPTRHRTEAFVVRPSAVARPAPLRSSPNNRPAESAAAGAIFGGLIGGPFGLLFGAQVGASLGKKRAERDEMERLGLTPEMLRAAEECGVALSRAVEGLQASQESLDGLQKLARRLDGRNEEIYADAKGKMGSGDEEGARVLLLERQNVQEKLKKTLLQCAEEKVRLERMRINVRAIEERGLEVEALLKRSVGAKAMMDTSDTMTTMGSLRLEDEDPLLRKFRDLENS